MKKDKKNSRWMKRENVPGSGTASGKWVEQEQEQEQERSVRVKNG